MRIIYIYIYIYMYVYIYKCICKYALNIRVISMTVFIYTLLDRLLSLFEEYLFPKT